ncbi:MAG: methionine adenosyltransferase, partial [Thermodesulfobacteriota bacterium]
AIVENGFGSDASVIVVSQIGKPINQPQILEIRIKDQTSKEAVITDMAREMIQSMPVLWKKVIEGEYEIV